MLLTISFHHNSHFTFLSSPPLKHPCSPVHFAFYSFMTRNISHFPPLSTSHFLAFLALQFKLFVLFSTFSISSAPSIIMFLSIFVILPQHLHPLLFISLSWIFFSFLVIVSASIFLSFLYSLSLLFFLYFTFFLYSLFFTFFLHSLFFTFFLHSLFFTHFLYSPLVALLFFDHFYYVIYAKKKKRDCNLSSILTPSPKTTHNLSIYLSIYLSFPFLFLLLPPHLSTYILFCFSPHHFISNLYVILSLFPFPTAAAIPHTLSTCLCSFVRPHPVPSLTPKWHCHAQLSPDCVLAPD